jgi:hypothetical protein
LYTTGAPVERALFQERIEVASSSGKIDEGKQALTG